MAFRRFFARRVAAPESIKHARPQFVGDRRTRVAHRHARRTIRLVEPDDDRLASERVAHGVGRQIEHGTAQQRRVRQNLHIAVHPKPVATLLQRGLEVVCDGERLRAQGDRQQIFSQLAAVGVRQEQHVVDHRGEPAKLFEVRREHILEFGGRTGPRQGHLGAVDQRGQRCAQLVGHIGAERFESTVGVLQAIQGVVEASHEGQQFAAVMARRQAPRQGTGCDPRRLVREGSHRPQSATGDADAQQHRRHHPEAADQHRGLAIGPQQGLPRPRVESDQHLGIGQHRPGTQRVAQAREDNAVFARDRQTPVGTGAGDRCLRAPVQHLAVGGNDPHPQSAIADQRIVQMVAQALEVGGFANFVDVVLHHIGLAFQFQPLGAQQLALQGPVQQRAHRTEDGQSDQREQETQAPGDRHPGRRAGHGASST